MDIDDGPFTCWTHGAIDDQGFAQTGHSRILMDMTADQQRGLTTADDHFKGLTPGMVFSHDTIQAAPWRRMRNQYCLRCYPRHQPIPDDLFPESDPGSKRNRDGPAYPGKMHSLKHHIPVVQKKNILFQGKRGFDLFSSRYFRESTEPEAADHPVPKQRRLFETL